jgi:hypothetical protein
MILIPGMEVNEMIDLAKRTTLLSPLRGRRPKEHPSTSAAFRPLLETLARASFHYGTALDSKNRRWIDEAHERWVAVMQELTWIAF